MNDKVSKTLFFLIAAVYAGVLFSSSAQAAYLGDKIEYAGYLETEVWIKNNNDNGHQFLTSLKNELDLGIAYKLSDNWSFFFHPRYFYDYAYSIRDDSSFDENQEKMGHTQRTEWLRDCYLDFTSPQLDIRLGKQQVAWSQADGLPFILDRVMPFNLSYFWLPDFADIRIPLWMAKVEYSPWLNSSIQFLFIPDFEASRSAPANSAFALKSVNAWDNFKKLNESMGGTAEETLYRPHQDFENSRIGLRWRSMTGGVEYTLNWLYGHTPSAYTYTDSFTPVIPTTPFGNYKVSRRHKVVHVIGGSFNKSFLQPGPFEGWTVRGEFAYIHDEPTYYGTEGSRRLTESCDKYNWFIGFDRYFFTNWLFSTQFAQMISADEEKQGYHILSGYTYGVMEDVENIATVKIATDFMHERLKPEVLVIWSDDNDGRIAFKTQYEINENLWFTLGYYHFWGPEYGSNGQFRNNDHTFCEIKYTF
ncbi:MAG: hypothetical protein GF375_01975 [Candidatus Omnitrophica bacterium]|nr:hypothetical protein [Candidatus Omnitrophota bacterium]MBD3268892.1 hypothetical protein [Candidatus Omnitrophota bacterium]